VRRATIAVGIVAVLASSCGDAAIDAPVAATLENRVATIRRLAEDGLPGQARAAARNLMLFVTQRMEAGRIDQSKAIEIIDAANLVVLRLELIPAPTPTESTSPSPPPPAEDEGGEGKPDKDEDPGKGRGNGNGDEGHGND
jgi:hypothetical protein